MGAHEQQSSSPTLIRFFLFLIRSQPLRLSGSAAVRSRWEACKLDRLGSSYGTAKLLQCSFAELRQRSPQMTPGEKGREGQDSSSPWFARPSRTIQFQTKKKCTSYSEIISRGEGSSDV